MSPVGMLSSVPGGFTKTSKLAAFADGSSAVALAGDPKARRGGWVEYAAGRVTCSGSLPRRSAGFSAAWPFTLAPSTGTSLADIFEGKHEPEVAIDIAQHGKCLKYSPSHFGSPWLAVRCARSDTGFSTLPLAPGANYRTTRVCQGGPFVDTLMQVLATQGPVTVTMPYSTANAFAHIIGPAEFGTPTAADDVPCDIADNVVVNALNARVSTAGLSGDSFAREGASRRCFESKSGPARNV
jgi:hypothetical protein